MTYAATTSTPVEKSKAEIEGMLARYGADQFMSGWDQEKAFLAFRKGADDDMRMVRLVVPMPDKADKRITHYQARGYWYARTESAAAKEYDQACRSRWRVMKLLIQAKLEAIELGISDFDHEFLADIVLPDGQPLIEAARPAIEAAYKSGTMPALLPAFARKSR